MAYSVGSETLSSHLSQTAYNTYRRVEYADQSDGRNSGFVNVQLDDFLDLYEQSCFD
jgi:hypothetical protein